MAEPLARLATLAAAHPRRIAFIEPGAVAGWADYADRVGGWVEALADGPRTVALLAGNGIEWAAIDLACMIAGVTFVPLPGFFSDAQLAATLAGLGRVRLIADDASFARAGRLSPAAQPMAAPRAPLPAKAEAGRRIIFTSGSTGAPKGVVLGAAQIWASATAIAEAGAASDADRHLSLMPLALLLEQVTSIHVPLLTGIETVFDPLPFPAATGADIAARFDRTRPTTAVLVPEFLALWVDALERDGSKAPPGLRFVAVGGAAVPERLAARAAALGIPAHEGYGLTECCSVVAVNRPGERRAGTVGRALPGLDIRIEDGEIVVTGPTVMDGYLSGAAVAKEWRTGDLGRIDADGYLTVLGRRDNLIVTALGRNVSPEWVETALVSEPEIAFCVVSDAGEALPAAVIYPAPGADEAAARAAARRAAQALPDYARPGRLCCAPRAALAGAGLLTPNGRPRRPAIAAWLRDEQLRAAPALAE